MLTTDGGRANGDQLYDQRQADEILFAEDRIPSMRTIRVRLCASALHPGSVRFRQREAGR